jgi:uncharacterized protein (TIGR02118 family)
MVVRVSAIYPNSAGSHFDGGYYIGTHTRFATLLLSKHGLTDIRSTLGIAALDGAAPPYWAISEMLFESRAAFDAAMAACGAALFADAANYTDVVPILQISGLPDDTPSQR